MFIGSSAAPLRSLLDCLLMMFGCYSVMPTASQNCPVVHVSKQHLMGMLLSARIGYPCRLIRIMTDHSSSQ